MRQPVQVLQLWVLGSCTGPEKVAVAWDACQLEQSGSSRQAVA